MIVDPIQVKKVIRQVAKEEILPHFQNLQSSQIHEKADGETVTSVDINTESRLSAEFNILIPDSEILGEEGFAKRPKKLEYFQDKTVWIIDPLDGTHNFVSGKKCFAVIVTLICNGSIEASWIHDPNRDITIYAVRREGAWKNNEKIRIKRIDDTLPIEKMVGSFPKKLTDALLKNKKRGEKGIPNLIKRYRCVGIEYMDLVEGKIQFLRYSGQLKPWDHSAGVFIYREIGGYDALLDPVTRYQPLKDNANKTIMLCQNLEIWNKLSRL